MSARRVVRLSFPMRVGDRYPPAIPPLQIAPKYSLAAGDAANVFTVSFANHSGTHVDAPLHVEADGLPITAFAAHEFLFSHPVVVDLRLPDAALVQPEHLEPHAASAQGADLLLLRFGYGAVRRAEPDRYRDRCPGFGVEGAACLRERFPTLRAVGMDVPSFSAIAMLSETMRAHNVVFGGSGRRFLIVEDMDLEHDLTGLCEVWLAPLLVEGTDSGPCTVFGVLAG